jgi:osmotically-inducible protein OsmY
MQDDLMLQRAVAEELEWAPHVDAANITVAVRDGIVRLSGFVASLAEKKAAERTVWHLRGVRGVAQEIEVLIPEARRHSDDEIAHHVVSVLDWHAQIPDGRIQVEVERGVVTLIGSVDWQFQKAEAEDRVYRIAGVTRVENRIVVRPSAKPTDIRNQVERALQRDARLHATTIFVQVDGSKVRLSGRVSTASEREAAENVAWSAAGVAEVDDQLLVCA